MRRGSGVGQNDQSRLTFRGKSDQAFIKSVLSPALLGFHAQFLRPQHVILFEHPGPKRT